MNGSACPFARPSVTALRAIVAAALCAFAVAPLAAQHGAAAANETSCRVCHPGAVRGLQQSLHASLLAREATAATACTSCHGDLGDHARAAGRGATPLPAVPRVEAARCASCHPGRELAPALAAHALRETGSGAPAPAAPESALLRDVQAQAERHGIDWSGFVEAGYRFVHRTGSLDGYRTDVDLDAGARLRAFEIVGRGSDAAAVDEVALRAHDLGDPRWDVSADVVDAGAFDVGATYRRDRFHYRASGDWHRVDRDSEDARVDATVELGDGLRAIGTWSRREEDGWWLTQRIGNRNLPAQTFVDGVQSPRRTTTDEAELGLAGDLADWRWTLAGGFFDQRDHTRWTYARPAPANPLFPESEDFASRTTLRGPTARVGLTHDAEDLAVGVNARYVTLERELGAAGTGAGFDVAPFSSTTSATGGADTQTLLLDADLALRLTEGLRLLADVHWRDHAEDVQLRQLDVSTYPTLGVSVPVATVADDETRQRLLDGSLALEAAFGDDLDVTVGWGYAHEYLRVPDLQPADPQDFRSGDGSDSGLLAAMRWAFASEWTLRGDLRDFGHDGVMLHELVPQRARSVSGRLSWERGGSHGDLFVRQRRNENDVSRYSLDAFTAGIVVGDGGGDGGGGGDDAGGGVSWTAGYTFANVDTRTLTNFWFDPDPLPVPTYVGFRGETHTATGSLVFAPAGDVRFEFTGAFTTTSGSFDVEYVDWRADLQWRATADGTAGIELRQLRYRDEVQIDDWRAELVFVYWRQQW